MNQLSHKGVLGTWMDWLGHNPKDFIETFGLIAGTLVTAVVAGLTFRLFQVNRETLESNSRQSNQNILGSIFEEGMLNVDKTMTTLAKVETAIQVSGDFYPNEFAPKREDAKDQKESAEKFGLRLDLYGVTQVSTEYKTWLQAMINFMTLLSEMQTNGHMSSYGMVYVTDAERAKYAPKLSQIMVTLNKQKLSIMREMNKLVSIS